MRPVISKEVVRQPPLRFIFSVVFAQLSVLARTELSSGPRPCAVPKFSPVHPFPPIVGDSHLFYMCVKQIMDVISLKESLLVFMPRLFKLCKFSTKPYTLFFEVLEFIEFVDRFDSLRQLNEFFESPRPCLKSTAQLMDVTHRKSQIGLASQAENPSLGVFLTAASTSSCPALPSSCKFSKCSWRNYELILPLFFEVLEFIEFVDRFDSLRQLNEFFESPRP